MKNVLILVFAMSASVLAALAGSCSNESAQNSQAARSERARSAVPDHTEVVQATPTAARKPRQPPARSREAFVGSSTCASCHPSQSDAFSKSHHAKALTETHVDATNVHLDGARFTSKRGGTTTFERRDGRLVVNTLATNGTPTVLPVPYVSGVWPLQQYVVSTERGKLQSLGVVWDSRGAQEGGQRWLHVYGGDGIAPNDPLFFTHATQNWNHMCADCHSTGVSRGYDVTSDSFDTQWAELSVGCEACHGPGAEHVTSAKLGQTPPVGFVNALEHTTPWTPSATGSPTPRVQRGVEVETCAPCHSRRAPLAEGFVASDLLLDHFEPELLWPGRYHADGQVEGEVYEWGSFTQSRMYQAGVTCSDCHNPHSGKPYASGDALCGRCHEPARFQVPTHSHHTGPNAPGCVDCHMPPATFMQVDERRDHSIRIPRPDHSVTFGTPNACNTCHAKENAVWARIWTHQWYPTLEEREHFVQALGKDRLGTPDAHVGLRKLALDVAAPAMARATALERLGNYPAAKTLEVLAKAIRGEHENSDPGSRALITYGATLGVTQLPSKERLPLLLPLLEHDVLAVRIAAAKALAAIPPNAVPAESRKVLERVFVEVEQSFAVNASRAETHVEQSAFELSRGRFLQAEKALGTALRLAPCLAEAHLNLAELSRQQKDEKAAERSIRAALVCDPKSAAAHHALGLLHVRAKHPALALSSLAKAVELAPSDARFGYVFAVALAGAGKIADAVQVLETNLTHHPNDVPTLQVLPRYLADVGQHERARSASQRLQKLLHD